jgi:hypothetical protein
MSQLCLAYRLISSTIELRGPTFAPQIPNTNEIYIPVTFWRQDFQSMKLKTIPLALLLDTKSFRQLLDYIESFIAFAVVDNTMVSKHLMRDPVIIGSNEVEE